jgi:hypothetical protein
MAFMTQLLSRISPPPSDSTKRLEEQVAQLAQLVVSLFPRPSLPYPPFPDNHNPSASQ